MKMIRPIALPKLVAPKFAQLSGMIVATIVVFGTDTDVLLAVPMGLLTGAMATFFIALSEHKQAAKVL